MNSTTIVTTAAELVAEARLHAQALPPGDFADEVDRGDAIAIDVREADERVRDGSIHGAIHIPRGVLEFRADPSNPDHDHRLRRDRRILLHSTRGERSALAAETLAELGYTDVAHLDGGLGAWSESGLPVYGRLFVPY